MTMYYTSENLFHLYFCVNVFIYELFNLVMKSLLHFVVRESFFSTICECFKYQMSHQEMNDIFYLSTQSSICICFVKMMRM